MNPLKNTAQFVEALKKENELIEISEEVDPKLDLAEIQRHVVKKKGPALLFKKVRGTNFPVATNLYGSEKRIDIAFSKKPEFFIKRAVDFAENIFPPRLKKFWQMRDLGFQLLKMGSQEVKTGPLFQKQILGADLQKLPQIKCWPEDGGSFITLPLVYTENPQTKKNNLGMYRIQFYNKNECGLHIQIHRGGGFHYHEAEKQNQSLPVHIYVGGPPALTLAAVCPLPEDVTEILLASLLLGQKIKKTYKKEISPLPFLTDADFCIVGEVPPFERKPEGPFGDHYGYYSLQHDYPFVRVKNIFHQENAIYPATVVGRPPQEDHYLACYLQEILKPLLRMVMPQVKEVWAYEESGVHSAAAAIVKDRYPREAFITALRILGEGQLSLTKVLFVTDQESDVKNFKTLLPKILERMDFSSDLHVLSHIPQDTLDYTTKSINKGSKAIFLGIGEVKKKLPTTFQGEFQDHRFHKPKVFCPGAIAINGPAFQEHDGLPEKLAQENSVRDWPLVLLVDNSENALKTSEDFLWHIFTRFEPAADIYAKDISTNRFHFGLTPPVVIDCRLKPWYPKVLTPDPQTVKNVEPILNKYGL